MNRTHTRNFYNAYTDRTRNAIYKRLAEGKSCKYIARRFNITPQSAAAFKFNFVKALNTVDF